MGWDRKISKSGVSSIVHHLHRSSTAGGGNCCNYCFHERDKVSEDEDDTATAVIVVVVSIGCRD
jgi:hypothetical protein